MRNRRAWRYGGTRRCRPCIYRGVPRRGRLRRVTAWLAAAALVVLGAGWCIEKRFDPVLDELAEYEATAAVTRAVNDAVGAELAHNAAYSELYRLEYGTAGEVLAVRADTAAINTACRTLVAAVEQALQALPECRVTVPFGTLTGFSLFNRLGPGWPLCFRPQAYVEGHIEESAEDVAINRTRYAVEVVLELTIDMILDGKNRTLPLQSRVPVASVLVDGTVPLCYSR